MSLSQPADVVSALHKTLSPAERERMARLKKPSAREKFAITRGLLRATLAYHLAVSPTHLRFELLPQGKPVLAHPATDVQFNLSHSRDVILLAVTHRRAVGVDVEYLRPMRDMDKFAARFFSENEREWLASVPPGEKTRVFFEVWTRKEAYLKACGDGITRQLRGIDVRPIPADPQAIRHIADRPDEAHRWRVTAFQPAPGYLGALAVEDDGWRVAFWQWDGVTIE